MDLLKDKTVSFYRRKFTGLKYPKVTVDKKEFEQCTFEKCSFVESTFSNCRFLDCTFTDCILSAVNPLNSFFAEIKFSQSKVIGFDWTKAKNIRSLEFYRCQLNYSNFSFLKLPGLTIKDSLVHEVDFTEADLEEADFQGSDFYRSRFFRTNLIKANFKKAVNYTIDFRVNKIKKAKFSLPEATALLDCLNITLEY